MKYGYCLWCRGEIAVAAIDLRLSELEWEKCRTAPCTGAIITVVTDIQGFVIWPYKHRGRYIYSKVSNADDERRFVEMGLRD